MYCNCLLTRFWRHEFWNWPVFSTWPKCQDKNLNILRTKGAFKMKQKSFFINFKGIPLKQIKQFFLECEGPTLNRQQNWNLTHFSKKRTYIIHSTNVCQFDVYAVYIWKSCSFIFDFQRKLKHLHYSHLLIDNAASLGNSIWTYKPN